MIVSVLDVNKVAYELLGHFDKVGAPKAENDSSNPPEKLHKNVFLVKILLGIYYIVIAISFDQPLFIMSMNTTRQNI